MLWNLSRVIMAVRPEVFKFFADIIYKETGIVYNNKNRFALENRLKKICTDLEYASLDEFFKEASGGLTNEHLGYLLETATNHETLFFRDRNVFDAIKNDFFGQKIAEGVKTIDVLSLACSTGQEPYSLAMILSELQAAHPGFSFKISASDISLDAVKAAEKGLYSQLEVQRGLPVPMLLKFFDQQKSDAPGTPISWVVKPTLRSHIRFSTLNLIQDIKFRTLGKYHLVLCRNVLIYHDQYNRKKIISNIWEHMKPDGVLVLGTAERVVGMEEFFKTTFLGKACFYKPLTQEEKAAG